MSIYEVGRHIFFVFFSLIECSIMMHCICFMKSSLKNSPPPKIRFHLPLFPHCVRACLLHSHVTGCLIASMTSMPFWLFIRRHPIHHAAMARLLTDGNASSRAGTLSLFCLGCFFHLPARGGKLSITRGTKLYLFRGTYMQLICICTLLWDIKSVFMWKGWIFPNFVPFTIWFTECLTIFSPFE